MSFVVEDVTADNLGGLNVLLYGPFGGGKTVFGTSGGDHPKLKDTFVIDMDGGLKSVVHRPNMSRVVAKDSSTVQEIFEAVIKKDPRFERFNTYMQDSLSAWVTKELRSISERNAGKTTQSVIRTVDTVQLQDYNEMTGKISRITDNLRGMGKTLVMTAVQRDYGLSEDSTSGPILRRPEMPPRLYQNIGQMMDMIWRVYQQNGEVYLQTQELVSPRGDIVAAKTRNPKFAARLMQESIKDKDGVPTGVIKIGKVGDTETKYPTLATVYDWYLEAIKD